MRGEEVIAAGGYLVQLLPEVHEPPLAIMAERLKDFENVDAILEAGAADPAHLLSEILYGMPYTEVGRDPVAFGCQCSVERLAASLATLPKHEIESFIADGKLLEIQCDYCGKDYEIAPELLRGLTMAN
jgi:molecular chaperone Hsp33